MRILASIIFALTLFFGISRPGYTQEVAEPHPDSQVEDKKMKIIEKLKETKFNEGLKFEDTLAEVAIGRVFSEVSKNNKDPVHAYFLSRIDSSGSCSFPSKRKINLEWTAGVDGFTALTYILNQALWHWEVTNGNLFIVPWKNGEDWSITGEPD